MRVTEIDSFQVEVPLTEDQQGKNCYNHTGITRIRTDAGITGYGFSEVDPEPVRRILAGQDPFAVERHVEAGLDSWYGAENALWDVVGKAAGLPLHQLLGAYRDEIPLYLTCVWPGAPDQTDVTPRQQAKDVSRYADLGYRAVKIRELVGGRDRIEVMLDRTGQYSGSTWDYATALDVARALEDLDATWLEEPFERGDIELHARLRSETQIAITGGEHQPPEVYPGYIKGGAFDVVQPHCANVFTTLKRVAGMAEMCGMACIFHGSHGMNLIGSLQVSASIRTCRMQELVFTTPPALPEEAWAPLNVLVRSGKLYEVNNGCVRIPTSPGLGIDLDEDAVERNRIDRP